MKVSLYSGIVKTLRVLLPVIGFVLLLTMFIWPLFNEKEQTVVLNLTGQKSIDKKIEPIMKNPRFHGLDKYNQQFYISAAKAKQINDKELELIDITSDITTKDNDWVSLIAKKGRLLHDKMYLYLDGDINILITDKKNQAYNINAETVEMDAKNSILYCTSKVSFKTPYGEATSNNCTISKDTDTILFEDGVKMRITKLN